MQGFSGCLVGGEPGQKPGGAPRRIAVPLENLARVTHEVFAFCRFAQEIAQRFR